MQLSPKQLEIFLHRLEIMEDNAIEVLGEHDGWEKITQDIVEDICSELEDPSRWESAIEKYGIMAKDILADCVNGGTWMACSYSEGNPLQIARDQRSCDALAKKISSVIGFEVEYPDY